MAIGNGNILLNIFIWSWSFYILAGCKCITCWIIIRHSIKTEIQRCFLDHLRKRTHCQWPIWHFIDESKWRAYNLLTGCYSGERAGGIITSCRQLVSSPWYQCLPLHLRATDEGFLQQSQKQSQKKVSYSIICISSNPDIVILRSSVDSLSIYYFSIVIFSFNLCGTTEI